MPKKQKLCLTPPFVSLCSFTCSTFHIFLVSFIVVTVSIVEKSNVMYSTVLMCVFHAASFTKQATTHRDCSLSNELCVGNIPA